jgi:hypothetical protein
MKKTVGFEATKSATIFSPMCSYDETVDVKSSPLRALASGDMVGARWPNQRTTEIPHGHHIHLCFQTGGDCIVALASSSPISRIPAVALGGGIGIDAAKVGAQKLNVLVRYQRFSGARRTTAASPVG